MDRLRVAVLGCGMISDEYLKGMAMFDVLDVAACADLDAERARATALRFGVPRAGTPQEVYDDDTIELVVNLTPPLAHAPVNMRALAAGKHVYCEKPLAVDLDEAAAALAAARERGLLVGCAPDTFLGGALQTARGLIDRGAIGRPVAASACFSCPGPEYMLTHPRAWYEPGGGPMLDMGPYYVTALIALLGPAVRVSGSVGAAHAERTATLGALAGTALPVRVPTHVTGTIEFASGALATVTMSWDEWATTLPHLEIYGTAGSITGPDPDYHDGSVRLMRAERARWEEFDAFRVLRVEDRDWEHVPLTHDGAVLRGIGVADMAYALRGGRPHRASGELALHALEIMTAFERSARERAHVTLASTCGQPAALPAHLPHGRLDG